MPRAPTTSESSPLISVIIVNWNRADDVMLCLRYLQTLRQSRMQIIVVDNGSTDGSAGALGDVAGITLIRLDCNLGPSRARNLGVAAARGKYTLFLDSDAVLSRRCIPALLKRMRSDPSIGIAGCRVMNWHTRKLDQWIYPQSARTHRRSRFDTYSFSAAGAMVRTDLLRRLGGFWEQLGIYNEEVDLSLRAIRAGYRVVYEPSAVVLHRPSPLGRASRANYLRLQVRNWIWIFFRHYPCWRGWMHVATYSGLYLAKGLFSRNVAASVRGIIEGVRGRRIYAEFGQKLSREQIEQIGDLNPRLRLSLRDWMPHLSRATQVDTRPQLATAQ